jgi:hypothetical protein
MTRGLSELPRLTFNLAHFVRRSGCGNHLSAQVEQLGLPLMVAEVGTLHSSCFLQQTNRAFLTMLNANQACCADLTIDMRP